MELFLILLLLLREASATAMVNLWCKYKNASKRKKQALHSLIVGLLLFGVFYLVTRFVSIPLCPIKNIFGISCPGCGMTRGFIAILKLDFISAIRYNVLSIPLFVGIIVYTVLCCTDIIFDRCDLERFERQCTKKYMLFIFFIIYVASICLNRLIIM